MSHVKQLTQTFRAMPPSRFREKLARTVTGVLLAVVGFGTLYAQTRGYLGKGEWLERFGIGAVGLGSLTASYEFVSAPLRFAVATLKDIMAAFGRGGPAGGQ
jgi:hypothetical protein